MQLTERIPSGADAAPDTLEAALARLRDAETRWRRLVEHSPVVTYVAEFDAVGTLRYVSPQIEALLGHPAEDFLADQDPEEGGLWEQLIHPGDRDRVMDRTRLAYESGEGFEVEYRMTAADGRTVHVLERDVVLRDDDGAPRYTQGIVLDVTALREAEQAVKAERDRAERYLEAAGTFVVVLDGDGRVTLVNRRGRALLGYEEGELEGCDWFATCSPEDQREADATMFARFVAGELDLADRPLETRVVARDGSERWVAWHSTPLLDDDGRVTGVLSSGIDVTERRRAEEQIAHLAFHDPLTGLPNRTLLGEHLQLAVSRASRERRSVAVLFLDLDDFKVVNDSLGHGAGDELLKLVAERLTRRRRAADLLARQGGDEFLLLLTDLDGDPLPAALAAAEAMLAALAAPFRLGDTEFHVGGSIGISLFPRDAPDAETLLAHADAAMYEAKGSARGDVRAWTGSDTARGADRLSRAARLRHAIERDELVLHYQPIFRAIDGRIRGAEALVRWQDPERGLLLPGEFVPLAEETGLIEQLGAWVLDAACAQAAAWRAQGHDVVTGINVSARELRRSDWARHVLARIDAHGVPPEALLVELTETTAMRGHGRIEEQLRDLHEAGVEVAIDDFGTGWSSLHRLRRLPVGMLKLDRSFLNGVPQGAEAAAVVRAILELGAALGKVVVAEGVETQRQLDFLVGQGCPLVQGFLLGRPEPPEALRLSESRPWRSPSTSTASSPSSSRIGGPARS